MKYFPIFLSADRKSISSSEEAVQNLQYKVNSKLQMLLNVKLDVFF